MTQHRAVMPLKPGCRIFFQLPLGHPANRAHPLEPFVSKPAGGTTVAGIVYHKGLVAVGCNSGLSSHFLNRFDTMQRPLP